MKNLFLLLILAHTINLAAQNQWEEIYTPQGGTIVHLTESPAGFLFARVGGSGIYRSDNNGTGWELIFSKSIWSDKLVVTADGVLFTSHDSLLYRSTNNGSDWNEVLEAEGSFSGIYIKNDSTYGYVLYVVSGSFQGTMTLHISTDLGETWVHKPTNIDLYYYDAEIAINSQGVIFLETDDVLYRSTDDGDSWETTGAGRVLKFLITPADEIIAGYRYDNWLYVSTDNGDTFTKLFYALDIVPLTTDNEGIIYASFQNELISISSDGKYWNQFHSLPADEAFSVLVTASGDMFVGMNDLYKSSDGGLTWIKSDNGISDVNYSYITSLPNGNLYIYSDSIYVSSDQGMSYHTLRDINYPSNSIKRVYYHPDGDIFASGINEQHYTTVILRSQDNGSTFQEVFVLNGYSTTDFDFLHITPQGSLLLETGNGLLRSSDKGINWKLVHNEYSTDIFISSTGTIYSMEYNFLYKSHDDGLTFEQVPQDLKRRIMTANSQGHLFALDDYEKVWFSSDEGSSWQQRSILPQRYDHYPEMVIDAYENLYVNGKFRGILRSTDGGYTWHTFNEGAPDHDWLLRVYDIHVANDSVIYAAYYGGIWERNIEPSLKNLEIANHKPNQLKIFPNPVSVAGNITVQLPDRNDQSVSSGNVTFRLPDRNDQTEVLRIYDLQGRIHHEQLLTTPGAQTTSYTQNIQNNPGSQTTSSTQTTSDSSTQSTPGTQINLSSYKPGVYIIKAQNSGAEGRVIVTSP